MFCHSLLSRCLRYFIHIDGKEHTLIKTNLDGIHLIQFHTFKRFWTLNKYENSIKNILEMIFTQQGIHLSNDVSLVLSFSKSEYIFLICLEFEKIFKSWGCSNSSMLTIYIVLCVTSCNHSLFAHTIIQSYLQAFTKDSFFYSIMRSYK